VSILEHPSRCILEQPGKLWMSYERWCEMSIDGHVRWIPCPVCGSQSTKFFYSSSHVLPLCNKCNNLAQDGFLDLVILARESTCE